MNHTTFTWQSRRGETIFGQEWQPQQSPRAAVVLVHGLGEHSSRYQHVAEYLTGAGYALLALDLPGHGKTTGARGYTSFAEMTGEVTALLAEARQRYPGLPLFIYGHSMGGALTLHMVLRTQPAIAGAIVTGPGLQAGEPVPAGKVVLSRVMSVLYPALAVANGLDTNNLSSDPQVVEAYLQDPLVHTRISVLLGQDILTKGKWIQAHAPEWRVPLLLMQGLDDHIVSQAAVTEFLKGVPAEYLTYRPWQGLRHELHNEPQQKEVLRVMVDWLNQHSTAS